MKTDLQGDTPKNRAEKANDAELAAYLESRQHYQMIQREDQETAVWNCWTLYEQDVDEETAFFWLQTECEVVPNLIEMCI